MKEDTLIFKTDNNEDDRPDVTLKLSVDDNGEIRITLYQNEPKKFLGNFFVSPADEKFKTFVRISNERLKKFKKSFIRRKKAMQKITRSTCAWGGK